MDSMNELVSTRRPLTDPNLPTRTAPPSTQAQPGLRPARPALQPEDCKPRLELEVEAAATCNTRRRAARVGRVSKLWSEKKRNAQCPWRVGRGRRVGRTGCAGSTWHGRPAAVRSSSAGRTDFQTCCCCARPACGPAGPSIRTDGRTFRPAAGRPAARPPLLPAGPRGSLGRTELDVAPYHPSHFPVFPPNPTHPVGPPPASSPWGAHRQSCRSAPISSVAID
jgi:hypothetical protein